LSQLGVTHTQNFEIPLKITGVKKIEISFDSAEKNQPIQLVYTTNLLAG
jgi:hypothetical protein